MRFDTLEYTDSAGGVHPPRGEICAVHRTEPGEVWHLFSDTAKRMLWGQIWGKLIG